MVKETVKEFGTIDILVNNAGIGGCSRLVKDMPEESWDQVMAINLKGVFLCCQAVVPVMIEKGRGKIVNIASLAARRMSFLAVPIIPHPSTGLLVSAIISPMSWPSIGLM